MSRKYKISGGSLTVGGDPLAFDAQLLAALRAGRNFYADVPVGVGTATLAPRTASPIVIGRSMDKSLPERVSSGMRPDARRYLRDPPPARREFLLRLCRASEFVCRVRRRVEY